MIFLLSSAIVLTASLTTDEEAYSKMIHLVLAGWTQILQPCNFHSLLDPIVLEKFLMDYKTKFCGHFMSSIRSRRFFFILYERKR